MTAQATPVEILRQAHATLLKDLQGLEWMADAPAAVSGGEWHPRLQAIRSDVAQHFLLEERDVYVSPVLKMEPAWERRARELLGEHRSLLQSLDALIADAAGGGAEEAGLSARVKRWADQIRQHEVRENELFEQAGEEDPCCRRD